jgi:8-oxo-dGTP pyrophosphatase MutT (NUDIX family)
MPDNISELPALIENLTVQLQSRNPRRLAVDHAGRAAVLMPILPHGEDFCFLLTQRTHKVETHKGQISFPGGIQEDSDSNLLQTALRETWEEIGLSSEGIHILGEFDEYLSITGLIVTPFAAYLRGPLNLAPNPDEVDEILRVPFSLFQESRTLRVETRVRLGVERKVYFYDFQGKEVWGLTAQIIRDFLRLVDQKPESHGGLSRAESEEPI